MKHIAITGILLAALLSAACNKSSSNNTNTTSCTNGPVCTYTLGQNETAGTSAASIRGTHTLTYDEITTGGPFPDGASAKFELTNDNKLVVTYNGKCVTIENPKKTSNSEVSYRDNCQFNAWFAASEKNGGGLNEVNVSSLGGQFYGQFK
jgi:ABC-type oligopeptide transport system substrate-binding subunit